MRRLARYSFTLCSLASLMMCGVPTASFVGGLYETDQLYYTTQSFDGTRWRYGAWGIASVQGRLILHRNDGSSGAGGASQTEFVRRFGHEGTGWRCEWAPLPDGGLIFRRDRWWNRVGFGYADMVTPPAGPGGVTTRSRQVVVPIAVPLLASAMPPVVWVCRRLVRRHRLRCGLCQNCGYDLRTSPRRCPECGDPVRTGGGA